MTDLKVVEIESKMLDEKIEKYFYWMINYGHEAASMWCIDNIAEHEKDEFKHRIKIESKKYGLK
jgi:hypothetical protein